MVAFNNDKIEIGKKYIYLKNERTGSSTIRKLKMVGEVVAFKGQKVTLKRLICPEKTEWENIVLNEFMIHYPPIFDGFYEHNGTEYVIANTQLSALTSKDIGTNKILISWLVKFANPSVTI